MADYSCVLCHARPCVRLAPCVASARLCQACHALRLTYPCGARHRRKIKHVEAVGVWEYQQFKPRWLTFDGEVVLLHRDDPSEPDSGGAASEAPATRPSATIGLAI